MPRKETGESARRDIISRRRLLASGATTVAVGLAGCSEDSNPGDSNESNGDGTGNGDGNGGGGGGGGGGTSGPIVDEAFTTFSNADPGNSHYNFYNPAKYAGALNNLIHNQLWRYNGKTGEWHDRIGQELSSDGKSASFTVNSDYKWRDGKSVTATDIEKQLTLEQYIDYPIWSFIDEVNAPDDQTIELTLKDSYDIGVLHEIVNRFIVVKRGSEYDNWLTKFEDAGGKSGREQVKKDFQTWTYAKDSNDPVSNGPYKVGQAGSGRFMLERNENFPYKTNIPNYELRHTTSDQQIWQLATSDKLDGAGIFAAPSDIQNEFPSHLKQLTLPAFSIYSPMWQYDSPIWGKREARQAFAFLIDRKLVDQNINPRHETLDRVTGYTKSIADQVLDDGFLGKLTNYGVESKPEKAAEKFREAGFSKDGGQWMTEDGNKVKLQWMGPSFPGSIGFAETLGQVLPDFGIEFEKVILAAPQWISRRQKGNFDLTFNNLGGGPHPYFFANTTLQSTRSAFGNPPRETVELPPVGKPDGQPQEMDLTQIVQDITTATDEQALSEAAKKYSWYFNQELPDNPLTESAYPTYVSTDAWQIPSVDDDIMFIRSPYQQLLRETDGDSDQALIQGKPK